MTISYPERLRLGLGALIGVVAAGLGFATSAAASDTFTLENTSKRASLQGTSDWMGPEQNTVQYLGGCTTGPWPAYSDTAYQFNPGDKGSIELSRDLFSECPSNINPQSFSAVGEGVGGGGYWAPLDPFIGFASLTCGVVGQTGADQLTASVDGLTCTVTDLAGAPRASFVSSAAPLRGHAAVPLIQHFARRSGTAAKPARGRHRVTIRSASGKVHGSSRPILVAGRAKAVRVPISRTLRKRVAKRGAIEVNASLKRIDGKPGTGDRATLVLMADDAGLPF